MKNPKQKTINKVGWAVIDDRRGFLPEIHYFFGDDSLDTYAVFREQRLANRYAKSLGECKVVRVKITYEI